ncbi:hypothetical protein KSC_085090 [Ktedonobacter sp. SOSP1-52]|uniref:hypothetical protein n=1 Tax=Ktedonobacter sp. SOSP1-52 TaxID=2778366 RepID=UPI001916BA5C|nr:hypothetical protein [Ktedonobacter sp. SOSP1-52]GHO69617.1 hypothetical protein KSC_085090 [Ktedonobacter sp. SOSP1-52]
MHIPGDVKLFLVLLTIACILLFVVTPLGISYWCLARTPRDARPSLREAVAILAGMLMGDIAALVYDHNQANVFFGAHPKLVLVLLLLINLPGLLFLFDYCASYYLLTRQTVWTRERLAWLKKASPLLRMPPLLKTPPPVTDKFKL